jgi:hypothetical protein
MRFCEVCGCYNAEKHHVVFRSQGGLDFELNYKYLCADHHKGNYSPHKNRYVDLCYKKQMQEKLFNIFVGDEYSVAEAAFLIDCKEKDVAKRLKAAPRTASGNYESETIVRALMGGKLY